MWLKKLIAEFIKKNGRKPNAIENIQLKFKANELSNRGQVINFPGTLREFTRKEDLYEGLPKALRNVKNPEEVKKLLDSGDIKIGEAPKTTKQKAPVDPKFKRAVESQEEKARLIKEFEARNKESAFNIAFNRYKDIDKRPMEMNELLQIYTNLNKYPKGRSIIIDDIYDIQRGYILPAIGNRSREMLVGKLNQMVRPTKKQPNPFDKAPNLKEGEQIEMDFTDWDPKGMAGGGLAYMLGEPVRRGYVEGGRIGFNKGGFNKGRRDFMKLMVGLGSLPFVGKFFKAAKPAAKAVKAVETSNAAGMPAWFPKLVDKVMKEGTDLGGTVERQIVKEVELPSGTKVIVDHDLTTGNTIVDVGIGKHGFEGGRYGQPARLELTKGEWIEPDISKSGKVKGKGTKTKDEFFVEEAEFTGGHPENIKYEESSFEKYGEHASDFSEVEKYATGKNVDKYNLKGTRKSEADEFAQGRAEVEAEWQPDWDDNLPDDYAEGGIARVGMMMGGFTKAQVLIARLTNTLKKSKDPYVKNTFPTFIKELKQNPELANDPNVWNNLIGDLPKNQRIVVHSDDSVDLWRQSDFGPHNIETTNKFMKKHPYLSRDEAVRIQNLEPEDQILEMKRIETIRNRTKKASGGLAHMLGE